MSTLPRADDAARLADVYRLGLALCAARTGAEAAGAIAAAVRARLGAARVWVTDPAGGSLGMPGPARTPTAGRPEIPTRAARVAADGAAPLWALTPDRLYAEPPDLHDRAPNGARALLVPLRTADGVHGVLVAIFDSTVRAAPDDLEFLRALGELAAVTLQRTLLEDAARESGGAGVLRAQRIGALAAALAAAMTVTDVATVLAEHVQTAVAADTFSLRRIVPEERVARAIRLSGAPIGYQERFGDVRLDLPGAVAEVAATKTAVFVRSAHDNHRRYGDQATVNHYEAALIEGLARLPLMVEGELIGILSVGYWNRQEFTAEDRLFLTTVADLAAQALGRATRTERLRQFQELSDLALSRVPLTELITDLEHRLASMLRAPLVAVYLHDAERLTFVSGNGAADRDAAPVPAAWQPLLAQAAGQRRQIVIDDTGEDGAPRGDASGEAAPGRAPAPRSLVVVPLLADREEVIGALVVGRAAPGAFTGADLDLIGVVATRVAIAVDRSQAFEGHRTLAHTLQAALLPPTLPMIPGTLLAARYEAAGAYVQVGGDFYDVFALGADAWLAVIGDVRGRGPAAAAVTGLIRHTLRAVAVEETSPAAILQRLNLVLYANTGVEDFATVACVRLQLSDAGIRLRMSSAGHCRPLILRAERGVEVLDLPGGILGAFENVDVEEHDRDLAPGDVLVLYTDGVTETAGPTGRYSEDRLVAELEGLHGLGPHGVVEAVHANLMQHCLGQSTDDIAILAIGAAPAGSDAFGDVLLDRTLEYAAGAAADSRRHVSGLAAEVADRGLVDDLRIVVSELVTNAFRHGLPDHDIRLRILRRGNVLRLEVHSAGTAFSGPGPGRGPLAEHGRGILIVSALSSRYGLDEAEGRVRAWCEFDRAPA